jgi:hypothetical protein
MTVGQVIVADMGINKKCQTFTFFVGAFVILGGLMIWNTSKNANV